MNKLILILTIMPMIGFASDVNEIIGNIKKIYLLIHSA